MSRASPVAYWMSPDAPDGAEALAQALDFVDAELDRAALLERRRAAAGR